MIALVIIIIVLLILAGVSIATLTGDNGILTQASKVNEKTEQSKVEEMTELAINALQIKNSGDTNKITPEAIAEQVNEDNNRSDVTASSNEFPSYIVYEAEQIKVPVDVNLIIGSDKTSKNDNAIYSEDIDESQIAPQELFSYEIISKTSSNTKVATTGSLIGLPQKEARITGIKPEYCNGHGYNPSTGENDLVDTNYNIKYEGITDTLIIPYQLEIDGEMYKVTEVDLSIEMPRFYLCVNFPSIENIIYPNTVKKIIPKADDNQIQGNRNITISNRLLEIPNNFFRDSEINDITIPDSVIKIGEKAFWWCESLTNVNLGQGIKKIERGAFCNCSKLIKINMNNSVTSIDNDAFRKCLSLESIEIPVSVTSIGDYAFNHCSSLSSVTYNGITYTSKSELENALKGNGVTLGYSIFSYTGLSN